MPDSTKSTFSPDSLPAVLFVDDDEAATRALVRSLREEGANFDFLTAVSATAALTLADAHRPEVYVIDLSIDPVEGPQSGLRLIEELRNLDFSARILVLTGHDDADLGLEALQLGATSFLVKPAEARHLMALLRDAISFVALRRQYSRETSVPVQLALLTGLNTRSPRMKSVLDTVAYAASNMQPVMLVGETGVGKGIVAQAIHRASARSEAPFLRYQPMFGNSDLVSSELFGHQKGAFTGASEQRKGLIEEAHGGTLFIDEVDELPLETQVLLLNVIQEKVFRRLGSNKDLTSDFRLIAATNQLVETSLNSGKLRQDFYHRIAHCKIEIPPLRERKEDIGDLSNHFIRELINRERLSVQGLTPEAMSRLITHQWPGNVRELQAVVEGGAYRAQFHRRRFIEAEDISIEFSPRSAPGLGGSFRERVQEFELKLIEEALERCENNQTKAAELLQLDRTVLRRILARKKDSQGI